LSLQTQADQLADAVTKINKLVTRLEQTKQQLDKANKEIQGLKDAAQVMPSQ
jgi:ABC-type transporter Mla subunit MlaD